MSALSELEQSRLENIRRNEEFLQEMGIMDSRNALRAAGSKPTVKPKKVTRVVKPASPPVEPRRSRRVTLEKLASEVKFLTSEGKLDDAKQKLEELEALKSSQQAIAAQPADSAESGSRYERILSDVSFKAVENAVDNEDATRIAAAFRELVQQVSSPAPLTGSAATQKWRAADVRAFGSLRNADTDIAKLTSQRITSVALHPSTAKVIAVAADKTGSLGVWDVDFPTSEDSSSHEGIYRYKPHVSNICLLHFAEQNWEQLHSVSYDGTIRVLDLSKDVFSLSFTAPEPLGDVYFSDACAVRNHPGSFLISKSSGEVSLVDTRASAEQYQWSASPQEVRLTSVQQHTTRDEWLITAGGNGGAVAVHDMRMMMANTASRSKHFKSLSSVALMQGHTKSINAAYCSPDGQFIVSVSQDDTICAWSTNFESSNPSENSDSPRSVLKHNNFTGRWLSTFRPAFDPKRANTFVMGSLLQPRRLEVFHIPDKDPTLNTSTHKKSQRTMASSFQLELLCNLQDEYLASVNSRNCFHKELEMVLGANSSGKVHLFR